MYSTVPSTVPGRVLTLTEAPESMGVTAEPSARFASPKSRRSEEHTSELQSLRHLVLLSLLHDALPISGQHLVEHDAQAEQVGAGIHALPEGLLRGHVFDRAEHRAGPRADADRGARVHGGHGRALGPFRKPEVQEIGRAHV